MKIGILEALGGSWGHLGPKMGSRATKTSKNDFFGPLLGAKLKPKIDQNQSQERSKMWSFFGSIWRRTFGATWCQLGPPWHPKPSQKWSQVGSKIDSSWSVDLRPVFWRLLDRFFHIFWPNITWPRARNHCKIQCFFRIFGFSMFGCWVVFWLSFDWFCVHFGVENLTKSD